MLENLKKDTIFMLFALALIPVFGLLAFIYFNDKKEKEPIGLLAGIFFAGMGTVVTAIIGEFIGQLIVNLIVPYNAAINATVLAIFVIAPVEELGKFAALALITWKNKNFNYSYDAIVYAVFASLGFACLENIVYVFSSGIGTAFLRMFTAVPGHACYGVIMGFFYSKAKYASLTKKNSNCILYIALSLIIPIVLHGFYDAIIMGGGKSDVPVITGLSLLLWVGYVIVLFIVSCIMIIYSAKHDFCIVTTPDSVQTVYRPEVMDTWKCICGTENRFNFCSQCGHQRPAEGPWNCPKCGTLSYYNFCGNCGCKRS